MKGIILAAGAGTRLNPVTKSTPKPLLPVYDKPMIYYPLENLMLAGIKDILIITHPNDVDKFDKLVNQITGLDINISFDVQIEQNGIADAFIIAEEFIGNDNVCLALCDNIFYDQNFKELLSSARELVDTKNISVVLGKRIQNPYRYGVFEFSKNNEVVGIEEKPSNPKSEIASVGLYFFTNEVIQIAKTVTPSKRGELEITSVIEQYIKNQKLLVKILSNESYWQDVGTFDSLLEASNKIKFFRNKLNSDIGCFESIEKKFKKYSKVAS